MRTPILALMGSLLFGASLTALAVTPEQMAAFQSLSPAQQKQLLSQASGTSVIAATPLTEPEVVKPLVLNEEPPKGLQPYGYDLFAGVPTTFAPATDVPVPGNYVIGPGDTVKLQEFGKEPASYELVVDRDGLLALPGVGQLSAAGVHFEDLKSQIIERIEQQKIGITASVTLGNLRSIRVFILGEARRPGSYTVSALTTMTNALFVSGGVKKIGSLRTIQLKRNGEVITELDLYDLLMRGDTSADARLQPGDVLFVPPRGDTVAVDGAVLRPAIYELKDERTVDDVLRLAGGLSETAWRDQATLERVDSRGERRLMALNLRSTPAPTLVKAGDKVYVQSVLQKVDEAVTVTGFAERNGRYAPSKGLRITDILPDADALKVGADLDFALLKRRNLNTGLITVEYVHPGLAFLQPKSKSDKRLKAGDELIFFSASETATSALQGEAKVERPNIDTSDVSIGVVNTSNAAGIDDSSRAAEISRVVGELIAQANESTPAAIAKVTGAVRFPGRYPLDATGAKVADLLRAAGGLAESAYLLEAEISRYAVEEGGNGLQQRLKHIPVSLSKAFANDPKANITLQPRDVLTVRYVPAWDRQYEVTIKGEVQFPGTYPVKQGETINDLITRAGGLTQNAFAQGAAFVRQDLKAKEKAQAQRLTRRLESDLAALSLQELAESGDKSQAYLAAQGLLADLKKYEASGRLVIDLPLMLSGEVAPLVLEGGDQLIIPATPTEVTVIGEVQFPTSHLFDDDFDRWDYIGNSGGMTERADKKRIFVVKANGAVKSGRVTVEAGDTVVVPLDADRIRPLTLWTSITQIVYQLGLAAASFKAIGAF